MKRYLVVPLRTIKCGCFVCLIIFSLTKRRAYLFCAWYLNSKGHFYCVKYVFCLVLFYFLLNWLMHKLLIDWMISASEQQHFIHLIIVVINLLKVFLFVIWQQIKCLNEMHALNYPCELSFCVFVLSETYFFIYILHLIHVPDQKISSLNHSIVFHAQFIQFRFVFVFQWFHSFFGKNERTRKKLSSGWIVN